jgi:hypothetical protein
MGALGSNGVLTLAEVQNAENGCTAAPAGDALDSNTDSDIAADFTQLSGGSSTMTLAQLTVAIQQDASPQNPHSYGKVICPAPPLPFRRRTVYRIPPAHLRVHVLARSHRNISGKNSALLKRPILGVNMGPNLRP